jgi:two-component system, OmpR family, response regulator
MKLLIVEDERKLANALKQGFSDEHFICEVAYDGDDGLSYALADEYDCIIMDRMLPGNKDGLEICQELRRQGVRTPILILTAKAQVRDKVDGLNGGADDYMVKPFSFEELLARVRALLRRPLETLGTQLVVDDLVLDPSDFSVHRGGAELRLTSTEFSLLEYLMRNQGRVLSKTNIISHVWDFDADILPNTVEAYVGYLRAKIDKPFADKPALIHTVRGFGYKLGVA